MIDIEQYRKILDAGLLLDHYHVLYSISEGKELIKSKRVQGFINLLCKKGYIDDGALTDIALDLMSISREEKIIMKPIVEKVQNEGKFDFAGWVIRLHHTCEDKIKKATGKRQARPKINGVSYSYLPNPTDLGKVILRVVGTYKLKDFDKIEKCIIKYVETCIKQDAWLPLLNYYIMKDGLSKMVTDMDNMDEEEDNKDLTVNI